MLYQSYVIYVLNETLTIIENEILNHIFSGDLFFFLTLIVVLWRISFSNTIHFCKLCRFYIRCKKLNQNSFSQNENLNVDETFGKLKAVLVNGHQHLKFK